MTETVRDMRITVAVLCGGIVSRAEHYLNPEGLEPKIVAFEPGKPTEMPKPYAEYMVAQDPTKFSIVMRPSLVAATDASGGQQQDQQQDQTQQPQRQRRERKDKGIKRRSK